MHAKFRLNTYSLFEHNQNETISLPFSSCEKQELKARMALVARSEPKIRLGTRVIEFAAHPEALNLQKH